MATEPSEPPGFMASLRSLGDGVMHGLQSRIELFTLELQEEKFQLIRTFIWISAMLFASMMAIAFASITLVYFFWDRSRLAVLISLTAFYAGGFAIIVTTFRRYIARQRKPFAATLGETEKKPEAPAL